MTNSFSLHADGEYPQNEKPFEFSGDFEFDEWIEADDFMFRVVRRNKNDNSKRTFGFSFVDLTNFALSVQEEMEVKMSESDASIISIHLTGSPQEKLTDFLNELTGVYLGNHLEEKEEVIEKTMTYLDDEVDRIGQLLASSESDIRDYKTRNKITSISHETGLLLDRLTLLEAEEAELTIKQKYYTYLKDFLTDSSDYERLISPMAFGVQDPLLNNLTEELVSLHDQKKTLEEEGKEAHPGYKQIIKKIASHESNILETVEGFETSNEIRLKNIEGQVKELEGETRGIPELEKTLLQKERIYELYEAMFRNLKEKKMEAEISKATLEPDIRVVEPAYLTDKDPILPDPVFTVIGIVLLTAVSTIAFLTIRALLSNKVAEADDVKAAFPTSKFAGSIGLTNIRTPNDLERFPMSGTGEQIRMISSQLQGKVCNVSSYGTGEGKTTIAWLLATSLAQQGKRTLLVDAGLADPRLHKFLHAEEHPGLIEMALGNNGMIDQYFQSTQVDELFLLSAGKIDRPADINKVNEELLVRLLETARGQFDAIVVDSPAIGQFAFSRPLLTLADANLLVVRRGQTGMNDLDDLSRITADIPERKKTGGVQW